MSEFMSEGQCDLTAYFRCVDNSSHSSGISKALENCFTQARIYFLSNRLVGENSIDIQQVFRAVGNRFQDDQIFIWGYSIAAALAGEPFFLLPHPL
jgi:hypothetical protein